MVIRMLTNLSERRIEELSENFKKDLENVRKKKSE